MTDDFRKLYECEWPSFEDDVNKAVSILAERLYGRLSPDMTGCTSYVQRKLSCGYNHAAAIMQRMEERGLITPADDKGARRLIQQERKQHEPSNGTCRLARSRRSLLRSRSPS